MGNRWRVTKGSVWDALMMGDHTLEAAERRFAEKNGDSINLVHDFNKVVSYYEREKYITKLDDGKYAILKSPKSGQHRVIPNMVRATPKIKVRSPKPDKKPNESMAISTAQFMVAKGKKTITADSMHDFLEEIGVAYTIKQIEEMLEKADGKKVKIGEAEYIFMKNGQSYRFYQEKKEYVWRFGLREE